MDHPVSLDHTDAFTPAHYGEPAPVGSPVYLSRPLSRRTRNRLLSEHERRVGKAPPPAERRARLRDGIFAALDGQEQTDALQLLDDYDAALESVAALPDPPADAKADDPDKAQRDTFNGLSTQLEWLVARISREYEPFRALGCRDQERTLELAYLWVEFGLIARTTVVVDGTEAPAVDYERDRDGRLTRAAFDRIPDDDVIPLANRIAGLNRVSESAAKNSGSEPGSPATPASSSAA